MLIRKRQLPRINDCQAIAGEHITTQHKPIGVRCSHEKYKTKQDSRPQDNQVVEMYIDGVAIEYRERVKVKYEELGEEVTRFFLPFFLTFSVDSYVVGLTFRIMMNQLSLSVAHSGRMLFSFISCFILSIHLSLGLPLGRDPGT